MQFLIVSHTSHKLLSIYVFLISLKTKLTSTCLPFLQFYRDLSLCLLYFNIPSTEIFSWNSDSFLLSRP